MSGLLSIGRRKTLPISEVKSLVYKMTPTDQPNARVNMRHVWNSIFASMAYCKDAYFDKKTQTFHVYAIQNDPQIDETIGVDYVFAAANKMSVEIKKYPARNITEMRDKVRQAISI